MYDRYERFKKDRSVYPTKLTEKAVRHANKHEDIVTPEVPTENDLVNEVPEEVTDTVVETEVVADHIEDVPEVPTEEVTVPRRRRGRRRKEEIESSEVSDSEEDA